MLKNYIITAWRNIRRNSAITWINIVGLSLGITCSIALFQWMQYGLAFNKHHENKDRIYRIVTEDNQQGQVDTSPGVPPPLPDALREDIGGIEKVVFFSSIYEDMLVKVTEMDDDVYHEIDVSRAHVEAGFFDVFSRPILQGSVKSFGEPNKVVISDKMRERFFGQDTDVIGRELEVNKETYYEVVAVMADFPNTTDFPFDILFSYSTIKEGYLEETGWGSISSDDQVYFLLENGVDPDRIQAQMPEFVLKYFGEENAKFKNLLVQPMSDFHYDTRWSTYANSRMSENELITMAIISFFLVLSAAVNFVNLSTALASRRARETGIRKVLGSARSQLVWQFLGETFMIVLISLLLSLGLAEILIIQMNKLFESEIVLRYTTENVFFFLFLLVSVTFFSGLYPALVLSGFKPVEALRSKLASKKEGWFSLRKGLVTTQFFISQLFIIGTLIMISQIDFMEKMELGYSADAVLNVPLPDKIHSKKRGLKSEVAAIPGVEGTSLIFSTPLSGSISITNFAVEGDPEDYHAALKLADEDYLTMYDIEIIEGEGLVQSDTLNRVVVNEEWLEVTGLTPQEAVGKQMDVWGMSIPITGVVKNFHTMSAEGNLQPVMIMTSINATRELSVKVDMSQVTQVLADLESTWKKFYPEYTFEYEFVDDYVARFYESEQEASTMITFFSMIAIGIGCLGLLGLIAYTTNRRTKEIGVRKVHGASIFQIISMLSGDVLKLVLLAFLFSAPLTWYLMKQWLENYSYHIPLNVGYMAAGLIITLLIAILTMSYRTYKAAAANPALSLRSE